MVEAIPADVRTFQRERNMAVLDELIFQLRFTPLLHLRSQHTFVVIKCIE